MTSAWTKTLPFALVPLMFECGSQGHAGHFACSLTWGWLDWAGGTKALIEPHLQLTLQSDLSVTGDNEPSLLCKADQLEATQLTHRSHLLLTLGSSPGGPCIQKSHPTPLGFCSLFRAELAWTPRGLPAPGTRRGHSGVPRVQLPSACTAHYAVSPHGGSSMRTETRPRSLRPCHLAHA